MCAASDRQTKLVFVKYVNETRKKIDNEMSVTLSGLRTSLPRKSSYAYTDLQSLLEQAEKLAKAISDRSLLTISKEGAKLFGSGAGGAVVEIPSDATEEVQRLQAEMEAMKERLEEAQSAAQISADAERILEEKDSQLIQLQEQFTKSKSALEEKTAEINLFQEQIDKNKIRVTEYLQEINSKQESIDDLNRAIATHQDDKVKLEAEIMKIGNTMMDYTTQVERLQAVLSSRDSEIERLGGLAKAQEEKAKKVPELEEAILKAAERINSLKADLKTAQEQGSAQMEADVQTLTANMGDLKDENESLQAENETLLAEVERTSRHAEEVGKEIEAIRKQVREAEESLKVRSAEFRVQETRIGEIENDRDKAREELIAIRGGELRELKNKLSSMETSLREKDIELEEKNDEIKRSETKVSANKERLQDLRQRISELEKERDELEGLIPDKKGIQNELNRVVKSLGESRTKTEELKGMLGEKTTQVESLESEIEELTDREERLEDILEDLKRYLSENPKYQILFILSDLKTTGVIELSKAIGRPVAVARQHIKNLESEGWVSTEEDKVNLEKAFLDI
ncbi:MAG: hypothetical protein ACXAEI_04085 [Candidatus Hodarchaeales archaeon]|jgi:chromosome segregation ATPase